MSRWSSNSSSAGTITRTLLGLAGPSATRCARGGAHADDVAAEQRTTIADAVASDGEILVAYSDGAAVGIGALRPLSGGVGEVKRMYVVPEYRGAGVAKRILDALEQLARERGFEAVRLDTHERLGEANRLYRGAGYREIEDYNGNPSVNRWFEKHLA